MNTIHKSIIQLTLFLSFYSGLLGQEIKPIQINLAIPPPYSIALEDYISYDFNIIMNVANQSPTEQRFSFSARLEGDNGFTAETNENQIAQYITLEPGETRTFNGQDLSELYAGFTEADIDVTGLSVQQLNNIYEDRILPEDKYTFCIVARDDSPDANEISNGVPFGCAEFEIIFPDRPIITNPIGNMQIPENPTNLIPFSWTAPGSITPDLLMRTIYDLKIIDITYLTDLSPTEAMLDPALDFIYFEQDINMLTHIPDLPLDLEVGHRYAVRVTAKDSEGSINYHNDGHSEVETFVYGAENEAEYINLLPPMLTAPNDGITIPPGIIMEFEWTPPAWSDNGVNPMARYSIGFVEKNSLTPYVNEFNVNNLDFSYQLTSWKKAIDHDNSLDFQYEQNPSLLKEGKAYHACIFVDTQNSPEETIPPFANNGWGNCISFNYGDPEESFSPPIITQPLDGAVADALGPGIINTSFIKWSPAGLPEELDLLLQYRFGIREHNYSLPEITYDNLDAAGLTWIETDYNYKNLHTHSIDVSPSDYSFVSGKQYTICPLVVEATAQTDTPHTFDNNGLGACVTFHYGEPEELVKAPQLFRPSEGARIKNSEKNTFEWIPSNFAENNFDTEAQYAVGIIEKSNELPSVPLHLRDNLDFFWSTTDYLPSDQTNNTLDIAVNTTEGKEYFACIRVNHRLGDLGKVENGGWGNCILLKASEELDNDPEEDDEDDEEPEPSSDDESITTECVDAIDFRFEAYYPLEGDTLPFTYFPIVAQFDPVCEEVRQIGFDLQFQAVDDPAFTTYNRTDVNNWPKGPLKFLEQRGLTDATPFRASLLPLNLQADQPNNEEEGRGATQGKTYTYQVPTPTATMKTSLDATDQTSGITPVTFNIGMPMPKLVYPLPNDTIAPGIVNLRWNTGNKPKLLAPPIGLIHIENSEIGDKTYFSFIDEHYILQVSKEEEFTDANIIYGNQGKIEYKKHMMDMYDHSKTETYHLDMDAMSAAVYKDITVSTDSIKEPGDYYWRIMWLRTDELYEDISEEATPGTKHILGNLIEEDAYRFSATRKFIIDENAKVDSTEIKENIKTNCFTENEYPAFDMTAVASLGNVTSFMAGYFAIIDVEVETKNGNVISGKGVVQIGFLNNTKVAVEFTNVKLNALNRMVEGSIKAVEDAPFSLADINSSIDGDIPIPGDGGTVNNWLAEKADLGRIVTDVVSDQPLGMPIGFKSTIQENDLLIGITEMTFSAKSASLKILYEHHFDKMQDNQYLSLAANIGFKPSGFQNEVMIHLNKNLLLENYWAEESERKIKYTVMGAGGTRENIMKNGTYLDLECNCVKGLGIAIKAEFDTDKIVKDTEDGEQGTEPVTAKFAFVLNREGLCNPEDAPVLPESLSDEDKEKYELRKTNFMVSFTMDEFQFVGLEGWGFKVQEGYLDYSSLSNPIGIEFPAGYTHAAIDLPEGVTSEEATSINNTWTGFYMKEVSIRAPKDFYKNNNGRQFKAGIQNIFIDNKGFSGEIKIENIIDTSDGETDGWAFSLDSFELNIVANTFQSGKMAGKLGIPITDEQTPYKAVLAYSVPGDSPANTKASWGFFMSIKPNGNLNIPPLLGTASLNDNSYVHYLYGKIDKELINDDQYVEENKGISLFFDGSIDINTTGNETSKAVATLIDFKGLKFDMSYSNKKGFDWDHTFASPQKILGGSAGTLEGEGKAGGFPVSIRNLKIENFENEGKCIGAELKYTLGLNLMGDDDGGIEAGADMGLKFSWNTEERRFKFDSLSLTCVRIGLETKPGETEAAGSESHGITLKGEVCVYKNKNRCGQLSSGFSGNIEVGLPIANIKLAADFGSTETFRYWYVDGKIRSNGTKIAPMGALDLIGISGGFYYNMAIQNGGTEAASGYNPAVMTMAKDLHKPKDSNDEVEASEFELCPEEGSYIFKAGLSIATAGDASIFNADVGAKVIVQKGQGLTHLSITGTGYFMTKVSEREDKPPIKADVIISYQKQGETQVFHAGFAVFVDIKVGPLAIYGKPGEPSFTGGTGKKFVECNFHLRTAPEVNDWYFKLGGPGPGDQDSPNAPGAPNPGQLTATLGSSDEDQSSSDDDDASNKLALQIQAYFQVGSDIDEGFMAMPPRITRLLGIGKSEGDADNGLSGGDRYNGSSDRNWTPPVGNKEGFILGLSADLSIDVDMFLLYAKFGLAIGFDLNVLNYGSTSVCYTGKGETISPVGSNGWYATGRIYAGIEGEVGLQIKFIKKRRIALFYLGAAFMVEGGFPNPVWAEGRAAIHYSILGGLISGDTKFSFAVGDKCKPAKTDPFGFALINEIMPANGAGNGDTKLSPFTAPQVSFNIPIHTPLPIPEISEPDEDGNVTTYIEVLYPYGDVRLMASNGAYEIPLHPERGMAWSEDKTIVTLTPKEPIIDNEVNVIIELRAKELKDNGKEIELLWPAGANKTGPWKEDSLSLYKTAALPDKIPMDRIADANPIVNQRYFLEQGPGNRRIGYLDFFDYLGNSYFYPTDDKDSYIYVARYYPFDGSDPLESKITSYGNRITYPIPSDLENDMIYKVNIVRVKKLPLVMAGMGAQAPVNNNNSAATIQGGNNPFTNNNPSTAAVGNSNDFDIEDQLGNRQLELGINLFTSSDIRFANLYQRMNFVTETRQLMPGSSVAENEFIIFEYHFKTSKYDKLSEKLAGASSELAMRSIYAGDLSYGEPWINMDLQEPFDTYDVNGYEKTITESNISKKNLPLVAFMPNYQSSYWKNKATIPYKSMLDFIKNVNPDKFMPYNEVKAGTSVTSDLRTGEMAMSMNGRWTTAFPNNSLARMMRLDEFNILFNDLDVNQPSPVRFSVIDPWYVMGPLTEEEVQSAWDITVENLATENYGEPESEEISTSNNTNTLSGNKLSSNSIPGGLTSGLGGLNSGIFNYSTSLAPELLNVSELPSFAFRFDLHKHVTNDIGKFKSHIISMYFSSTTMQHWNTMTQEYESIFLGNVQRRHLEEELGNDFGFFMFTWTFINQNNYSMQSNPGVYGYNVNHLRIDGATRTTPWPGNNINLQFNH